MIDLTSHIQAARQRKREQDRYWAEAQRVQAEQHRRSQLVDFRSTVTYNFGGGIATELGMTFGWFGTPDSNGRPCAVIDAGHGVVVTLLLEGSTVWHVYRFDAHAVPLDSRLVCQLNNRDQNPENIQQRRDCLLLSLGELLDAAGVSIEAAPCS